MNVHPYGRPRTIRLAATTALIVTVLWTAVRAAELSEISPNRLSPAVRAVRRVLPSVVSIRTEKRAKDTFSPFGSNRKVNGMGTGLIFDPRGYIVTNYHVVADVLSVRVTDHSGAQYDAAVLAFDAAEDLAILKVKPSRPLPVMPVGTSSDILLGETVLAIGNAYGYEDTVTGGMVSALGRDVEVNEHQSYRNLIQTDASINPGNSGGPLVNLDGEVIGINVAIRAGAQRIGFAIPIDDARRVMAELIDIERLDHTWHGLQTRDVKSGRTRYLLVEHVRSGSPAAAAGFLPGDRILRAGEFEVVDRVDFERACLGRGPEAIVPVRIRRGDDETTLSLRLAPLGRRPQTPVQIVARKHPVEGVAERIWNTLGLQLHPVPRSDRRLRGLKYHGGLVVSRVRPDSPAAENGIREGDILVGLHVWETVKLENVLFILQHKERRSFEPLKFYVVRDGETLFGHLPLSRTKAAGATEAE
ncbi:MAG: PDZ domain-containing protein [Planctomycetota bacterium]|nr:MAG: PDZ domain-containing protein [Planctomycetota bacterium]